MSRTNDILPKQINTAVKFRGFGKVVPARGDLIYSFGVAHPHHDAARGDDEKGAAAVGERRILLLPCEFRCQISIHPSVNSLTMYATGATILTSTSDPSSSLADIPALATKYDVLSAILD